MPAFELTREEIEALVESVETHEEYASDPLAHYGVEYPVLARDIVDRMVDALEMED
jgi:hypothetical protein